MSLREEVPPAWRPLLARELSEPFVRQLEQFLDEERASHPVYPREEDVFRALFLTPPDAVRAVILGQDPYHGPGQAHGLAFSVPEGVAPPPSLLNIFRELESDLGCPRPPTGSLEPWAQRGVLLLNAVLTVRESAAGSHRGRGWERVTDEVLRALSAREERIVFVLWGNDAQRKTSLLDTTRHVVLAGVHPSPLSAHRGFFGSRPFSRTNAALSEAGRAPIEWCL